MAEAGSPEAIMPLKRGKDGKLGVASDGGGGGPRVVNVSMNVQTKDADSFRRSRVQIQSDLKRMTTNMGLS
jgi:phage-related minor tail protein